MKKILIPALSIMLLLPFMYGGCLSSDDAAKLIPPDVIPPNLNEMLIGTWFGTGEYTPPGINGTIAAQVNGSIFATIRIEVTDAGGGDLNAEFFINGENVSDLAGTDVGAEISTDLTDPLVTEPNAIVIEFAPGSGLSSGGLLFDDTIEHAFFFIHNEIDASDVAWGVIEKGATAADIAGGFSSDDMLGMWTGSDYAFFYTTDPAPWDIDFLGKNDQWDLTMVDSSGDVAFSGTGGQGDPVSMGELIPSSPTHGIFFGTFVEGGTTMSIDGFLSPDRSFFGGFVEDPGQTGPGWRWSDIVLTKTP